MSKEQVGVFLSNLLHFNMPRYGQNVSPFILIINDTDYKYILAITLHASNIGLKCVKTYM